MADKPFLRANTTDVGTGGTANEERPVAEFLKEMAVSSNPSAENTSRNVMLRRTVDASCIVLPGLEPLSPCPKLAFEPGIQSVDLLAGSGYILEETCGCCWKSPCFGSSPFDWISFLHEVSRQSYVGTRGVPLAEPPRPSCSLDTQATSEVRNLTQGAGCGTAPTLDLSIQEVRRGVIPAGGFPSFATLVCLNQVIFSGVKEVNTSYKRTWFCIYFCTFLAFMIPVLGVIVLLLLCCSRTVKRSVDEYVQYRMSQACLRANTRLQSCGVELMLMAAASESAFLCERTATALLDHEMQLPLPESQRRLWLLRIFMLPPTALRRHQLNQSTTTNLAPVVTK